MWVDLAYGYIAWYGIITLYITHGVKINTTYEN